MRTGIPLRWNGRFREREKLRAKAQIAFLRGSQVDFEPEPLLLRPKSNHPTRLRESIRLPGSQNGQIVQIRQDSGEMCALRSADEEDVTSLYARELLQVNNADSMIIYSLSGEHFLESSVEWVSARGAKSKRIVGMLKCG